MGLTVVVLAVPAMALVALGIGLVRTGRRSWRRYADARWIPFGRVGDIPAGVAEIRGRIAPAPPRVAPLAGRPCVAWSGKLLGPCSRWDGERSYVQGFGDVPDFLVEDGTGSAVVATADAEIRGLHHFELLVEELRSQPGADLVRQRIDALVAAGLAPPAKVAIDWIESGDPVHVLGQVERRRHARGEVQEGYRGVPVALHVVPGPFGAPIVSSQGGTSLRASLRRAAILEIVIGAWAIAMGVLPFGLSLGLLVRP